MKRFKNFIMKYKYFLLTILLTIVIIGIIFLMKGIYPFGSSPFSLYDFDHAYVPVYYKLWDLLHGSGGLLFDWNLGAGLNVYGSLVGNSIFLPTSLMIGLFSRSFVPYAMSFVVISKLLTVSICTYIAISKLFPKVKGIFKVISTLLYTFSGWTIFMVSSLLYLDVLALFPLFVLAFYRLLKDGKWGMYVIVLTLCLLLNYYMSWLILFFIIGTTIISLLVLDIKEKKKKAVLVLLLTLLSLGISCILFLPSVMQALTSFRMKSAGDDVTIPYLGETFLKIVYLLPMAIPMYFTFKQLCTKKDKRVNIFFGLLLLYLLIGVFVPPINAMWHTGSYSGLPFRYAYIPSFVLILISLYYLQNNFKEVKSNNKVYTILPLILMIIIGVLAWIYRKEYLGQDFLYIVNTYSQFFCLLLLFVMFMVTISIIVKNNKKVLSLLLMIVTILQISIYGYYFIDNGNLDESTSVYTQNILDSFKFDTEGYNLTDQTNMLNVNFPYILDVPSMENRLHFIKEEEINFSKRMGYYAFDTFIYSRGGTLFSNLLMQNKYHISSVSMDERLYTLIDKKNDVYLYESNYNLNYIVPYSGNIVDKYSDVLLDNNNLLYKGLFNKETDIMHLVEDNEKVKLINDNVYYFYSNDGFAYDLFKQIKNIDGDYYRNSYMSYDKYVTEIIVNKDVELDLTNYNDLVIGYINVEEFIAFVDEIDDYDVTVSVEDSVKIFNYNAKEDTSLLIPVNYDDSLVVKVNDKKVDYKLNAYNMVSIDVLEGNNKIEVSYVPKFMREGIIATIISLIIMFIIWITNKKFKYLEHKFILYPLFIITSLIGLAFILKIYILFWL